MARGNGSSQPRLEPGGARQRSQSCSRANPAAAPILCLHPRSEPGPPSPTPRPPPQVPIAVRCPLTGRWHIVHWIDSKACFGDDRLHAQALEGQYRTYLNRYGSGAVIYWLGFVADLAAAGGDGEVLLLERFPAPGDVRLLGPPAGGAPAVAAGGAPALTAGGA
jgi:hypothetical protein